MKTMSALESQGENIERWEEVVDGINQVKSLHDKNFLNNVNRQGILKVLSLKWACKPEANFLFAQREKPSLVHDLGIVDNGIGLSTILPFRD